MDMSTLVFQTTVRDDIDYTSVITINIIDMNIHFCTHGEYFEFSSEIYHDIVKQQHSTDTTIQIGRQNVEMSVSFSSYQILPPREVFK